MKNSVIKKATATTLAILTIMCTLCFSSFATRETGGAYAMVNGDIVHYETINEAWYEVVTSKTGGILFLNSDWTADENGNMGTGTGFTKGGAITIANKSDIRINLNGYKIDRGLTQSKAKGCVFYISNSRDIEIVDGSPMGTGTISGGFSESNGGAILVKSSTVSIENLTICGNTSKSKGGAIYIGSYTDNSSATYRSEVKIDNCTITGNKATTGGAIYLEDAHELRVYDSTITGNKAKYDAGIHTEVRFISVSRLVLGGKVVIADNEAEVDGTGLMLDESTFTKVIVKYDSSRPLREGSRIVILSKTDDNTLRITDDSDEYNFDCFEYENGKYEIVKKGSGSDKYLDIKKA